jgi:hypothetical protein
VASSSSVEESERMYSGTSSVPKISSGSKSRLKTKEGESWDCSREQEKGLRRKAYSRMVRFFGGALLSSTGYFPLSAMALGVFSSREAGWEDVKWWKCMQVDLQSTKGAILLAVRTHWEWWLDGVH